MAARYRLMAAAGSRDLCGRVCAAGGTRAGGPAHPQVFPSCHGVRLAVLAMLAGSLRTTSVGYPGRNVLRWMPSATRSNAECAPDLQSSLSLSQDQARYPMPP